MKKLKSKQIEREKRVKVGFNSDEYLELQRAAQVQNISMSDLLRLKFLTDGLGVSAPSDKPSIEKINSTLDFLSSRILKLESVLRILVVNTALIRGHTTGVVDLSPQASQEVLKKRMIESRDYQKKLFFELYPEMREEAQ